MTSGSQSAVSGRGNGEAGGHHADHLRAHAVDAHRPAQHPRVAAELAAPQRVAQHRHRRSTRPLLRRVESAPQGRRDAQHREQRAGRPGRRHPLRHVAAGQVDQSRPVDRHLGQRAPVAAVEQVGGVREAHLLEPEPRKRLPQTDQPVRARVRQRPQQHGVDDAEHRRVGADRHRQRQHAQGGEPRRPPQPLRRPPDQRRQAALPPRAAPASRDEPPPAMAPYLTTGLAPAYLSANAGDAGRGEIRIPVTWLPGEGPGERSEAAVVS